MRGLGVLQTWLGVMFATKSLVDTLISIPTRSSLFSDTAPTCTDIFRSEDGVSSANGICDYKEHAQTLKMGKKQRGMR